jgi:flagellar hook-associated protein 2
MAITFGGLATGLDTNALITELMNAERTPLTRLETDKTWLNNRLAAFQQFDKALQTFKGAIDNAGDRDQYFKKTATLASEDFFTATASEDALANTSYDVEVKSLAQVQKSYTNTGTDTGFASKTSETFGTGTLSITIDGVDRAIEISEGINSLEGIMNAINEADIGVSANIINDGSDTPYRLSLTGKDVGVAFTVDESGLTGGTESLGTLVTAQEAASALIEVDGLEITSTTNTIEDAIPGVTLDLLDAELNTTTKITIGEDNSSLQANVTAFVTGYNSVVSFISSQSTIGGSEGGILAGDSGLNSIKRHLQEMLTTITDNDGPFKAMSQLGLETQKDGTVILNTAAFQEAVDENADSVISLLSGNEDGEGGIIEEFTTYLEGLTHSSNGVLAGRSASITRNVENIDERIAQVSLRLEKREETLRSQFSAMESLVSTMNAQSSFLTQQMSAISNLGKQS